MAALARELASTARLEVDATGSPLRDLLRRLDVPESSQILTFGKISLQAPLISPGNPRAIYFNDTTVVAWPAGGFIEIATQDPTQGAMFYILDPRPQVQPQLTRQSTSCLGCHLSYATLNVPGFLAKSVAAGADGRSMPQAWNGTTTHRTPLPERWAGWFVTGSSGDAAHLGNQRLAPDAESTTAAPSALRALADGFPVTRYLSAHSDIAALLVFDHQMQGLNLLTRLGWEVRVAMADRPDQVSAIAERAAAEVADYLLFLDEAPLGGPVAGSSGFARQFATRGPRDRAGRSLRDLDLTTRLLAHPLSYLVYAPSFDALPPPALNAVYARLWQVLSGRDRGPRAAKRSPAERQALVEILRDTKPGLPAYFQGAVQ